MENTSLKPDRAEHKTDSSTPKSKTPTLPQEIGGAPGHEPTRHGDWVTHKGRCTDF